MTKTDKNAYIQLEKACETMYKTKTKIQLIDKYYEDIFKTNEDYQSLKQSYKLEEKYSSLKCLDIISNNQTLTLERKRYQGFKSFHKSRSLIYDIALVFIPILVGGIIYSVIKSSSLIWLFASLSMITLGILGYIYFNNSGKNEEYYGPISMQIKVLKRIDSMLISGQLYEEVIKDCQLQFAKRKLINKAKEKNVALNFDLTETNTFPKYVENYIYAYSGLTNIKNLMTLKDNSSSKDSKTITKKKSSESATYLKYTGKSTIKTTPVTSTTTTSKSTPITSSTSTTTAKKKSSESPTYLKYTGKSTSKTTPITSTTTSKSTPITSSTSTTTTKKKSSESATYLKYTGKSTSKTTPVTSTTTTSKSTPVTSSTSTTTTKKKSSESPTYLKYKNSMSSKIKSRKTVIDRYEGNSTITRVAVEIEKPKSTRKKSSESSVYLKYLKQKEANKATAK